jgi:hypothetical protein
MSNRTKLDKIFDNTFGESEFEADNLVFKIDPTYDRTLTSEEHMHTTHLFDEVNNLVLNSKYADLNKLEKDKKISKLNKVQINEVFTYIIDNLEGEYRMIEVFSCVSDYFDIYPKKFYTSISNKYKTVLLSELEEATGALSKKNINKIF